MNETVIEHDAELENAAASDAPSTVVPSGRNVEWDSWFQGHLNATKNWRNAAYFFAFLSAVVGGVAVHYASKPERTPYVVAVDGVGQARLAGQALEIKDWPETVVKAELARFVRQFRSVPADAAVIHGNYTRLQSFVIRGSSARAKIVQYGDDLRTNPFERVKTGTSAIKIVSVNQSEGNTFFVDWDETERTLTGEITTQHRYRGSFVVSQAGNLPREQLLVNPLGLIVVDFDIQRIRAF